MYLVNLCIFSSIHASGLSSWFIFALLLCLTFFIQEGLHNFYCKFYYCLLTLLIKIQVMDLSPETGISSFKETQLCRSSPLSHLRRETDHFQNVVCAEEKVKAKSKYPVILSVMHHHVNPSLQCMFETCITYLLTFTLMVQ
jgi:hypothetical protein